MYSIHVCSIKHVGNVFLVQHTYFIYSIHKLQVSLLLPNLYYYGFLLTCNQLINICFLDTKYLLHINFIKFINIWTIYKTACICYKMVYGNEIFYKEKLKKRVKAALWISITSEQIEAYSVVWKINFASSCIQFNGVSSVEYSIDLEYKPLYSILIPLY